MEEICHTQGVDEVPERFFECAPDVAELLQFLIEPRARFFEDAVLVECLREFVSQRNEPDRRAQEVRAGTLDIGAVDRIEAERETQHVVAGDVAGFVGKPIERVLDEASRNHRGARVLVYRERVAPRGSASGPVCFALVTIPGSGRRTLHRNLAILLHDVRDLVPHEREVFGRFARRDVNVVTVRDRTCPQKFRRRVRVAAGMHAHLIEADAERFFERLLDMHGQRVLRTRPRSVGLWTSLRCRLRVRGHRLWRTRLRGARAFGSGRRGRERCGGRHRALPPLREPQIVGQRPPELAILDGHAAEHVGKGDAAPLALRADGRA